MRDPANWAIHQRATAEILARPGRVAREIARLARPWNVDLAAIARAGRAVERRRDEVASDVARAPARGSAAGDAPVHVVAGAATFGLMAHYADALRFAAQLG